MSIRLNHMAAANEIRRQGRSITDVAQHLGMDRANLSHCLAGRRQYPADLIPALADLLGVNPYEILGPTDPRAAVLELAQMYEVRPDELTAVSA